MGMCRLRVFGGPTQYGSWPSQTVGKGCEQVAELIKAWNKCWGQGPSKIRALHQE